MKNFMWYIEFYPTEDRREKLSGSVRLIHVWTLRIFCVSWVFYGTIRNGQAMSTNTVQLIILPLKFDHRVYHLENKLVNGWIYQARMSATSQQKWKQWSFCSFIMLLFLLTTPQRCYGIEEPSNLKKMKKSSCKPIWRSATASLLSLYFCSTFSAGTGQDCRLAIQILAIGPVAENCLVLFIFGLVHIASISSTKEEKLT